MDLLGFMDDDFGAPVSAAPAPAVKPAEKALPALVPAANPLDGAYLTQFSCLLYHS